MKTILATFGFIALLAGCSNPRYSYSPTAHNVPLLTKKGDSKAAVYYSTNGPTESDDNSRYEKNISHGTDIQGAYAITNNIAIQSNFYYRAEKSVGTDEYHFESSDVKYRRNLFEIAGGFYSPIDKAERMVFQVYAGIGLGKTTMRDHGIQSGVGPYTRFYDTRVTKYFLQPSLSFRTKGEAFALSFATRASLINFGSIKTNYSEFEQEKLELDSLDRYPLLFFEPSFVGSFGFNKLPGFRIEMQVGLSILREENFIDYRPFNFSLGLIFDIGKLVKGFAGKSKD